MPEGALDIPYLKQQPEPLERELYVDLIVGRALRIQVHPSLCPPFLLLCHSLQHECRPTIHLFCSAFRRPLQRIA